MQLKLTQENGKFVAERINAFNHSSKNFFDTEVQRNDYIIQLKNHLQWKGEDLKVVGEYNG